MNGIPTTTTAREPPTTGSNPYPTPNYDGSFQAAAPMAAAGLGWGALHGDNQHVAQSNANQTQGPTSVSHHNSMAQTHPPASMQAPSTPSYPPPSLALSDASSRQQQPISAGSDQSVITSNSSQHYPAVYPSSASQQHSSSPSNPPSSIGTGTASYPPANGSAGYPPRSYATTTASPHLSASADQIPSYPPSQMMIPSLATSDPPPLPLGAASQPHRPELGQDLFCSCPMVCMVSTHAGAADALPLPVTNMQFHVHIHISQAFVQMQLLCYYPQVRAEAAGKAYTGSYGQPHIVAWCQKADPHCLLSTSIPR